MRMDKISNSLKNISPKYQIDYCGKFKISEHNNKKLCDYHILSADNCFLIGHQLLDYCSLDMIKKTLSCGVRYIEIPIYDLESKADTIPVTYIDYKGFRISLNYLEFKDIIKMVSKLAFNNRFINNYEDPMFLFLNIKTTNIKTLEKVYNDIKKFAGEFLLDSKYNNEVLQKPVYVS